MQFQLSLGEEFLVAVTAVDSFFLACFAMVLHGGQRCEIIFAEWTFERDRDAFELSRMF